MDPRSLNGRDVAIDVETDLNANMDESSSDGIAGDGNREKYKYPNKTWSGFANVNESIKGNGTCLSRGFPGSVGVSIADGELVVDRNFVDEENKSILDRKTGSEKPKKKISELRHVLLSRREAEEEDIKPPKPPRPPKALLLASSEEKLVREISELALLKRARMERMKALKKMKNVKTSSSSTSNLWALIITILFCFVIFWQGFSSRCSSNLIFEGSPVSSVGNRGGLISVHYYNNASESKSVDPSLLSSNVIKQASGLEHQDGDASNAAR